MVLIHCTKCHISRSPEWFKFIGHNMFACSCGNTITLLDEEVARLNIVLTQEDFDEVSTIVP